SPLTNGNSGGSSGGGNNGLPLSLLAPLNTAAPAISGSPQQGQTLTTSTGSWIGDPLPGDPTTYGYQWEDCDASGSTCTPSPGATASSYLLGAADVGQTIRSVVTASDDGGSASATSANTAVVSPPPAPSNTGIPVVSGQPVQGQTLSSSSGSWSG